MCIDIISQVHMFAFIQITPGLWPLCFFMFLINCGIADSLYKHSYYEMAFEDARSVSLYRLNW